MTDLTAADELDLPEPDPVPPLEEQEAEYQRQLEQADPIDRDRGPVDD